MTIVKETDFYSTSNQTDKKMLSSYYLIELSLKLTTYLYTKQIWVETKKLKWLWLSYQTIMDKTEYKLQVMEPEQQPTEWK